MFYRRSPTTSEYSSSELLNNQQLHAKLDILLPSLVHIAESKLKNSIDTGRKATRHPNIHAKLKILAIPCTSGQEEAKRHIGFP